MNQNSEATNPFFVESELPYGMLNKQIERIETVIGLLPTFTGPESIDE